MKLLFLFLAAFWSASAQALISDTTIGNGGDVVKLERGGVTNYFLLDLFETRMERAPYFDESLEIPAEISQRVSRALPDAKAGVLVARKIAEITGRDRLLGLSLLRTLELLQWRFVGYPLKNVPDEGTVYDGELFQAAIRQGATIFIQSSLWEGMADDKQRAALVLHELIYALYAPEAFRDEQKVQRSYRVREINAYLFDEKWRSFSAEEFYRMLDGNLPTSADSGLRTDQADANRFYVAPMLSLAGNIPMPSGITSWAFAGLRSKRAGEIDGRGRIDALCRDFSNPLGLSGKSGIYEIVLAEIPVSLRRETYKSPLGLLDYIDWRSGASDTWLPPYDEYRASYPRWPQGEAYRVLSGRVIFDFRKYVYGPEIAERAREACLGFLDGAVKEFEPLLDEYR